MVQSDWTGGRYESELKKKSDLYFSYIDSDEKTYTLIMTNSPTVSIEL